MCDVCVLYVSVFGTHGSIHMLNRQSERGTDSSSVVVEAVDCCQKESLDMALGGSTC